MTKHLNLDSEARGDRDLIAIRAAMNILEKWGCSTEQQQNILQLSRAALYKYRQKETKTASLTHDQLTRISYLLNMHSALRIVFSNPGERLRIHDHGKPQCLLQWGNAIIPD
ncbi:Uncharacterised protein [Leclercia adecarboxylata]|uniref:Antitoxin Xre-like helix-turn-helix domain-containing protein n=1 Tax=Leclercia adecarboxylata TaxID=83655 RepID=A0A4U9HX13_9ENTR|nr:Uncharacterised protein [Leclercia adecarboxylata]